MIENLIKHKKTILLTGPTGSGKTSWTYRTFKNSKITHVNICEIDDNLLSSQLFGHERGSFTGALNRHDGFVAKANKGVLFLDEIGDLKLEMQKKLLMFMDDKKYFSLGSTAKKTFDGQIVVATNKNLAQMVSEGSFREDLYYRLKTFEFEFTCLNHNVNKREIIERLLNTVINKLGECRLYSDVILDHLCLYEWPGNYRELIAVLEYIVLSSTKEIKVTHLPKNLKANPIKPPAGIYAEAKSNFERKFLKSSLMKYNYKINETARNIKMSKVTLLKKIKEYQLVENDI